MNGRAFNPDKNSGAFQPDIDEDDDLFHDDECNELTQEEIENIEFENFPMEIFEPLVLPPEFKRPAPVLSLENIEGYQEFTRGQAEIVSYGIQVHNQRTPLALMGRSSPSQRTFLMKDEGGHKAALVRTNGDPVERETVIDYLQSTAQHVTGHHIREMGIYNAALYDMVLDFATLHCEYLSLGTESHPSIARGLPSRRHALHKTLLTIEVKNGTPVSPLTSVELPFRAKDWEHWLHVKNNIAQWQKEGRLPVGVSYYRPKDLRDIEAYSLMPARQAKLGYLTTSSIGVVVSPSGTVVAFALAATPGLNEENLESGDIGGPVMRWFVDRYPKVFKAIGGKWGGWSYLEPLYLCLAEMIANESRAKGEHAWPLSSIPSIPVPPWKENTAPFVLDTVVLEPDFNASDIAEMISKG